MATSGLPLGAAPSQGVVISQLTPEHSGGLTPCSPANPIRSSAVQGHVGAVVSGSGWAV